MQFRCEWPAVQLDYWPLADMELYRRVLDGRLDFALLLQPPVHVDTLTVRCTSMQPLRVIAAPGHRLTKLHQVCAADLVGRDGLSDRERVRLSPSF